MDYWYPHLSRSSLSLVIGDEKEFALYTNIRNCIRNNIRNDTALYNIRNYFDVLYDLLKRSVIMVFKMAHHNYR